MNEHPTSDDRERCGSDVGADVGEGVSSCQACLSFAREGSNYSLPSSTMSAVMPSRLTLSIEDLTILRATPFRTLLFGFGSILRGSPGGIGMTGGEHTYSKSHMVKKIDIFLSHSWHAHWLPKYLVLLLHFNVVPAVSVSCIICLVWFLVNASFHTSLDRMPVGHECWSHYDSFPVVRFVGSFIFLVILLTWHVVACDRMCPEVFLDKVCIDQVDLKRKEHSIKSIGGFLKNSKSVLVTWDSSYFERLWCTFELSAYFYAHPKGKITFLPCALGNTVVLICLTHVIAEEVFGSLLGWRDTDLRNTFHNRVILNTFSNLPINMLVMPVIKRYLRHTSELDGQLERFGARNAKCFCCSVGHIHPDTGNELPCDRDVVYASIAEWYGHGNTDRGLRNFDERIRGKFRQMIRRRFGGSVQFPYSYALVIGIPDYVRSMAYCYSCPLQIQIVRHMGFLFLRGPIIVMMYLKSTQLFKERHSNLCLEVISIAAASLCATFSTNLFEFTRDLYWVRSTWYTLIIWYMLEAASIMWVWRPWTSNVHTSANRGSTHSGRHSSVGSLHAVPGVELATLSEKTEPKPDGSTESW